MLGMHVFLVILTGSYILSQEIAVSQVTRTETIIVTSRNSSPNQEKKLLDIEDKGLLNTISSPYKTLLNFNKSSGERNDNNLNQSSSIKLEKTINISNIHNPQAFRNMSEKSNQNNTTKSISSENNENPDKIKVESLDVFPVNSNNLANSTIDFKPSNNKTVIQSDLEGPSENSFNNVTFKNKSAFDGDQCPTGYVKVNGQCVVKH